MAFKILRNDITKVRADAIVNTANPIPVIGRGTDSSIYEARAVNSFLKPEGKSGSLSVDSQSGHRPLTLEKMA